MLRKNCPLSLLPPCHLSYEVKKEIQTLPPLKFQSIRIKTCKYASLQTKIPKYLQHSFQLLPSATLSPLPIRLECNVNYKYIYALRMSFLNLKVQLSVLNEIIYVCVVFILYNKQLQVKTWFITRTSFWESRSQLCLCSRIENQHSKEEISFQKHSNLQSCKTNKYPMVNSSHEFYACKVTISIDILLTLSLPVIAQK